MSLTNTHTHTRTYTHTPFVLHVIGPVPLPSHCIQSLIKFYFSYHSILLRNFISTAVKLFPFSFLFSNLLSSPPFSVLLSLLHLVLCVVRCLVPSINTRTHSPLTTHNTQHYFQRKYISLHQPFSSSFLLHPFSLPPLQSAAA